VLGADVIVIEAFGFLFREQDHLRARSVNLLNMD